MTGIIRPKVIIGQSNAVGSAGNNPPTSPKVPDAAKCLQFSNGALSPANDPVGPLSSGSAWPAYARKFYYLTGQAICFVPCAVGSTAMQAAADTGPGNWDVSGALLTTALNNTAAALTALTNAGWSPSTPDFLWCQGEQDAECISSGYNNGACTEIGYKDALYNMIARIQAAYPGSRFLIFRTAPGYPADSIGWQQVRQAQEDMASFYHDSQPNGAISNLRIVWRGSGLKTPVSGNPNAFAAHGLLQPDDIHYTQAGYNLMGTYGALADVMDGILNDEILLEPTFPNDTARISWQTD